MNARNKLNAFWLIAAIALGLMLIGDGSKLLLLIVVGGVIAWAVSQGHIR